MLRFHFRSNLQSVLTAAFSALIEKMTERPLNHAFNDQQWTAARERIVALHQQWLSTPQGSSLELALDRKQNS